MLSPDNDVHQSLQTAEVDTATFQAALWDTVGYRAVATNTDLAINGIFRIKPN